MVIPWPWNGRTSQGRLSTRTFQGFLLRFTVRVSYHPHHFCQYESNPPNSPLRTRGVVSDLVGLYYPLLTHPGRFIQFGTPLSSRRAPRCHVSARLRRPCTLRSC